MSPALLVLLLIIFFILSILSWWMQFRHLKQSAEFSSRLTGQIIAALNDPTPGGETNALLELGRRVSALGIPVVVTDPDGDVTSAINLPFESALDDPRIRRYAQELDRQNAPISEPDIGVVHYGELPVSFRLKLVMALTGLTFALVIVVGLSAYRATRTSARDHLWVAMARETAHQMGTPLMSLAGWIEHLKNAPAAPPHLAQHLEADLEQLERVARRFERIGRPARRDEIGLGALAERVADYYRPRLPQLAQAIHLNVQADGPGPIVLGDRVLLEWAVESLVRNAVDALSGRGGHIVIIVTREQDRAALTVRDDGAGVPESMLGSLFEPGVTTKTGGWGIGLALTQRIIQDQHEGELVLNSTGEGAEFVIRLPTGASG